MKEQVNRYQKILVVDDGPQLRELQRLFLEPQYDVETASSGESALDALDPTVCVVLLDRKMPGLTGTETAIEIDRSEHTPAVAIVSANPPETDIFDIPCDACLEKPVGEHDLVGAVEELLSRPLHNPPQREYHALRSKHRALDKSPYGNCYTTPEYKHSVKKLGSLEERIGITDKKQAPVAPN
ncbi:response regulator [Halorubrum sp. AJ67]|uniref:response regulator n=1 Tax=Halorubrum sp. AJ67 TaxID=1173487 RepID=UPI0003DD6A7B|nr:response regulator [Halorubrum sp. AJ67]CDK38085.1 response regulator [Halorubrum sp. AJ67]